MKKPEEIYDDVTGRKKYIHLYGLLDKEPSVVCMKEFAKEILKDFDNWKAHKTPDLVEQYIKEKGL